MYVTVCVWVCQGQMCVRACTHTHLGPSLVEELESAQHRSPGSYPATAASVPAGFIPLEDWPEIIPSAHAPARTQAPVSPSPPSQSTNWLS